MSNTKRKNAIFQAFFDYTRGSKEH